MVTRIYTHRHLEGWAWPCDSGHRSTRAFGIHSSCLLMLFLTSVHDPYVVGLLGSASGSVIYLYGSGSGSFRQQAKK